MSNLKVVVRHARNAQFERGLRSFFEYRDLGIGEVTEGRIVAHVIRAIPGETLHNPVHSHETQFQMVYILCGWIEFEYEGYGRARLEVGSSVYQPPGIRHKELGHSDDLEMLEIVMPGQFRTEVYESTALS